MSHVFWNTVQKARKEHFCDRCRNWIERGDRYIRELWSNSGNDSLFVYRRHEIPDCPLDDDECEQEEVENYADGNIAIVLATEIRQVLKVGVCGETIIENETHLVTAFVYRETSDDSDDELIF